MRFSALRAPWYKGYLAGGSLGMTGDHVERALTDGAGRPQDGDALDGVLGHGMG